MAVVGAVVGTTVAESYGSTVEGLYLDLASATIKALEAMRPPAPRLKRSTSSRPGQELSPPPTTAHPIPIASKHVVNTKDLKTKKRITPQRRLEAETALLKSVSTVKPTSARRRRELSSREDDLDMLLVPDAPEDDNVFSALNIREAEEERRIERFSSSFHVLLDLDI